MFDRYHKWGLGKITETMGAQTVIATHWMPLPDFEPIKETAEWEKKEKRQLLNPLEYEQVMNEGPIWIEYLHDDCVSDSYAFCGDNGRTFLRMDTGEVEWYAAKDYNTSWRC